MSDSPEVNIQWKNTDVCLDFHCTCSPESGAFELHFDGFAMMGRLECPNCGVVWQMSHSVRVEWSSDETGAALMESDG